MNVQNENILELLTDNQLYSMIYGKLHNSNRWGYTYQGIEIMTGIGSSVSNFINKPNLNRLSKHNKLLLLIEIFNEEVN